MKLVDRYIFIRLAAYGAGIVGISLLVLMLERMLRLFDLTVSSEGTIGYVAAMLLNLIPHYLGIALPAAFFFAILMTIHHLSDSGELTALQNAGVGLPRILKSIMVTAFVLSIVVTSIVGIVQPHSRYSYRALVHLVTHQSLTAVLREGAFVTMGDLTFMAERRQRGGDQLRKVFVFSKKSDGRVDVTTAPFGSLKRARDGNGSVLALRDGTRTYFAKEGTISGRVNFEFFSSRLKSEGDVSFRKRGIDTREMTLHELWSARSSPPADIPATKIAAEFNSRIVRALTMLILPLLAIPFGLSGGRSGQSCGIAAGLFVLVLYQKALELGTSFAGLGMIPPWLGAWLPFFAFAALGVFLFVRVGYGVSEPPLAILTRSVEGLWSRFGRTFARAQSGR